MLRKPKKLINISSSLLLTSSQYYSAALGDAFQGLGAKGPHVVLTHFVSCMST